MLYTFTHIIHHVYSSLSVWVNCWHYIVFNKIVPALTLAWLTVNTVLQVCFLWRFKVAAGATEVAVFGSASETFSKKNINCSVDESMLRFEEVINAAKKRQIPVRGLVFCLLILCYKNENKMNEMKWKQFPWFLSFTQIFTFPHRKTGHLNILQFLYRRKHTVQ